MAGFVDSINSVDKAELDDKTSLDVQSSNEVVAISLSGGGSPSTVWKAEVFAKMKELRYLLLDGCKVKGDFSGWSKELRWLQWRYFPYDKLPLDLKVQYLAVLDLANSFHLTHP
jgi:hypothetical protein